MSDDVAPFEDEPLTLNQARENLERAIRQYNAAINIGASMPVSAVAAWAIAIDERLYLEDGVVPSLCILEPPEQPEYVTQGLLRAVLEMGQFVEAYDEDDD